MAGNFKALIELISVYDVFTGIHVKSTEKIAAHIGRRHDLTHKDLISVTIGAVLHDIGKVGIPQSIICKPAALTPEERIRIQDHSTIGKTILDYLITPWNLSDIANMHHERLDGSGYPNGLTEPEITDTIRDVSVSDVYDILTADDRPYRAGWKHSKAVDYLYANTKQFDANIVKHVESYDPRIYNYIE